MNWRVSALDKYILVSNSDAHSPGNLAREANVFNTELSYRQIYEALENKNTDKFYGTLEFFPEEGKYHFDGHRKCGLSLKPSDTINNEGICPVCGGRITVGVLHRVEALADRQEDVYKRQGCGGIAEAVLKMAVGNMIGFRYDSLVPKNLIFEYNYGGFVIELNDDTEIGIKLGYTTADHVIDYKCDTVLLDKLTDDYEAKLESVYPCNIKSDNKEIKKFEYKATSYPVPTVKFAKPRVLIPVFPGTNCEYDSARRCV